jgi:hypothetical protein
MTTNLFRRYDTASPHRCDDRGEDVPHPSSESIGQPKLELETEEMVREAT